MTTSGGFLLRTCGDPATVLDAVRDYVLGYHRVAPERHVAVVLDIDDTALFTDPLTGRDSQVAGLYRRLYAPLVNAGVKVVFVTARQYSEQNMAMTQSALYATGFVHFHSLFMMPSHYARSEDGVAKYKTYVREFLPDGAGLTVVANVGNTWQDLLAPVSMHKPRERGYTDDRGCYYGLLGDTVVAKLPTSAAGWYAPQEKQAQHV